MNTSTSSSTDLDDRVSKRDLLREVAQRSGVSLREAERVYDALLLSIVETVRDGKRVNLTGFGTFFRRRHGGHKVQFGREFVEAYPVMRFAASAGLKRHIARSDDEVAGVRVPGTRSLTASNAA